MLEAPQKQRHDVHPKSFSDLWVFSSQGFSLKQGSCVVKDFELVSNNT